MRILHTSDWHLGRQFHGVALLDDQRDVLTQVLTLLEEERIDVLIIAGDIYDRAIPPAEAITVLDTFLAAVLGMGIRVIMISGNHDSGVRLGFASHSLQETGLYISGQLRSALEPIRIPDVHGEVLFFPLPYADPLEVREYLGVPVANHAEAMVAITEAMATTIPPRARSILVAHCFVEGSAVSESERPLSVGGIETVPASAFTPFDYVALGHLHSPQYRERESIRYSGSILKYSFSEISQAKSVTIVDMDQTGQCDICLKPLQPTRDMRLLEGSLEELLAGGQTDPRREDYLLVRLTDTHAILDVMPKLRAVYPNTLHVERPQIAPGRAYKGPRREQLGRQHLALFADFYQQMQDQPLSPGQQEIVLNALQSVQDAERSS